jgi:hypothetical protein
VYIIVVLTSRWPSSSSTVRMSWLSSSRDNFAKAGMSKADVHQLLRSKAGRRVGELKRGGLWREERLNRYVTKVDPPDDNCWVPTIQEPSRLFLIVAGGRPGATSAVMHGWNETTRGFRFHTTASSQTIVLTLFPNEN